MDEHEQTERMKPKGKRVKQKPSSGSVISRRTRALREQGWPRRWWPRRFARAMAKGE